MARVTNKNILAAIFICKIRQAFHLDLNDYLVVFKNKPEKEFIESLHSKSTEPILRIIGSYLKKNKKQKKKHAILIYANIMAESCFFF